jgi:hypothetical protein
LQKIDGMAPKNATEMVAHESDEHVGKVTAIPEISPTLQI